MGTFFLPPVLAVLLLLAPACDDINDPPRNNFVPPVPAEEAARAKGTARTMLTREEMEADYNFILTIRTSLQEMGDQTLAARSSGDQPKFSDSRANFNYQYKTWTAMIKSRKGVLDSTGENYPEGHPAKGLQHSFRLLRMEMEDYYRVINDMKAASPDADAKLMETMKQVRAALDREGQQGSGGPIPLK